MRIKRMNAALPLAVLPVVLALANMPALAAGQQAGVVVARDAQTGQLRAPTPAEMQALAAAAARAAQPLSPPVVRADGSRILHLGERGLVYSVVTLDADGKLHDQCVQGAEAARQAIGQAEAAARDQEQRHE
jgi:hypothetical protein